MSVEIPERPVRQNLHFAARAAVIIAAATSAGCDSIATWLALTLTSVAPICCAIAACKGAGMTRRGW